MEYVDLAGTGLRSSRVGLGTWAIGGLEWGGADDAASIATIHRALEMGITLIDTAPIYGHGHAEEVVGRALKDRRNGAIIASKAGLAWSAQGDVRREGSRSQVLREFDDSLRRLHIDYIDLYQVHWPEDSRIEETAQALHSLLSAGKIRAIGVSNFSPAQMDRFKAVAPLHAVQPPYNLFERDAEHDVLPYAAANGIAALTYGALCRGLLGGQITEDTIFSGDDLRREDPKFQQPRLGQYARAVRRLDELAQQRFGKRVAHLAVRWVLDTPGVSVALRGARRPHQLDDVSGAFGFHIDEATRKDIDRILADEIKDPIGPDFLTPPGV